MHSHQVKSNWRVYSILTKLSIELNSTFPIKLLKFTRPQRSHEASYENIDNIHPELELHTMGSMLMATSADDQLVHPERIPLDARQRRPSMKRLVRQASTVNTQKIDDGTIKLTYWF